MMLVAWAVVVVSLSPWPDPFDESFVRNARKVKPGDTVVFRPEPAREWVDAIRRLPEASPGKQQYVQFLKDEYGYQIDRLNAAYGLQCGSFTELLSMDYRSLDRGREAVVRDDAAFLKILIAAAK
jgi:hypothetical protein